MLKLLMVDDETFIVESIRGMLNWQEMNITLLPPCVNAFTALETMKDEMPDILLADVRMQGMSGLELVEQARTLNPELYCIVISSYEDFDHAQRAMRAGVEEYLLKPCSLKDIRAVLLRARDRILARREEEEKCAACRREQVEALDAQLLQLKPERQHAITARQVRKACASLTDSQLLQEALICLASRDTAEAEPPGAPHVPAGQCLPADELYARCAELLTRLADGQDRRGALVQQMKDFVQQHYDMEELSLQYLAENVVFLSADHVGKEFIKATGMKFSAYLLSVRMEQAKRLLAARPALRAYEVAEQVGLGHNPRYFSQLFKKYTGLSPAEYANSSPKEDLP